MLNRLLVSFAIGVAKMLDYSAKEFEKLVEDVENG
jgi:hypothetical protein